MHARGESPQGGYTRGLGMEGLIGIPVVEGMYSVVSDVGGASYRVSYNSSTSTLIIVGGFHLMFLLPTSQVFCDPPEVLAQPPGMAGSQDPWWVPCYTTSLQSESALLPRTFAFKG
eukprot:353289-Chlamydomonas_euryale.AAC.7